MIVIRTKNPNFNGWRAGIEFRNGEARVSELSGKQRQALAERYCTIEEPELPAPIVELADMTVADLRAIADAEEIALGTAKKKADIVAVIEAERALRLELADSGNTDPAVDPPADAGDGDENPPAATGDEEGGDDQDASDAGNGDEGNAEGAEQD